MNQQPHLQDQNSHKNFHPIRQFLPPPKRSKYFFNNGPLTHSREETTSFLKFKNGKMAPFILTVKNARIVGRNRICNEDGQIFSHPLLPESHMDALDSRLSAYEWQGNINFKESPTKSFDKIIYIEKAGNHIYGHWLVDILPRIHFLKKSGEFEDYQWLFSDTTPDFALRLLDQLGINSDNRVFYNANEEIVKANVLVVPSMLRWHSTFFEDTAEFYEQFISSFSLTPAKRSRKILISRQSWNKPFRRLVNFRELQSISEEYSYEVISPEQYPLEEQLRIFASAASVVGENSSALHNTLFSPSGTPTLSLQSEFNNNTIQSGIADLKKQSMGYIYGLPLSLPGYRGYKNLSNFFISPKLFRQALQKMERLL